MVGKESRFVHYAMTSSDCIDTAVGFTDKSLDLFLEDVSLYFKVIQKASLEHKNTLMVEENVGCKLSLLV